MGREGRMTGLDLIKVLAVIFVISIHTIGNLHVLAMDMQGVRAFVIIVFRYFVMSCVPLFLMITGFLQGGKQGGKKFYLGLVSVMVSYLFIASLGAAYNMSQDASVTWGAAVLSVLDFTANNYAWYVEMFIGLYLLIPFFNAGYAHLETKKAKLWLLFVLVLLTIAPSLTTVLKNEVHDFDILPNYWIEFYPVTFYMIGVYLREYRPRPSRALCALVALAAAVIPTVLVFAKAGGGPYVDYVLNGFYSASSMLAALGVFLFFYDTNCNTRPVRFILSAVAVSSLDIYLFSNLAEKMVYPLIGEIPFKLPATIALIFFVSLAAAKGKALIFWLAKKMWQLVRPARADAS